MGNPALPRSTRCVIAAVVFGALVTTLFVVRGALAGCPLGPPVKVGFFAVLISLSWRFPLVMDRGRDTEAVHADEGALLVAMILLPPLGVIAAFGIAVVVAQVLLRRPWVKSLFNVSQVVWGTGLALGAVHLLVPEGRRPTALSLAAVAVGTLVYFVVNGAFIAMVLASLRSASLVSAFKDGIEIRLLVWAASVVLGSFTGLALAAFPWMTPAAFLPFLIVRQILAGHFRARRDRARVQGLLQATLDAHGTMGAAGVEHAITEAATELLRAEHTDISITPPSATEIGAEISTSAGRSWLVVHGRNKLEPLEPSDQAMLEALAAVGSGALANAALYEEVAYERERLTAITSSLGEGVAALDALGRLAFLNPAAAAMLGIPGGAWVDGPGPLAPGFLATPALEAMAARTTVRSEDGWFARPDESGFPVAFTASPVVGGGEVTGAVVVFRDITERKAFEEQLAHHAFHDSLTGLANRPVFLDRLDHLLEGREHEARTHAVLFVDVDRFKVINDNLGHQAGDELLIAIGSRLASVTRPEDTLARFGGDEFTVLFVDVDGAAGAMAIARRINAIMADPVTLADGHDIFATVSIGIALSSPGRGRDDLLHDADVAMYRAKARGAGHVEIFDVAAMAARSAALLDLETELRKAIEHDEIELLYQPIFTTVGRAASSVEALVRWRHPTRGVLAPAEFIALAEDTGLIVPLGQLVLAKACQQTRRWNDVLPVPIRVSVNLSARQFQHHELIEDIVAVLAQSQLDARHLCLEITESLAMADIPRTLATLRELKRVGVALAIDDFGTGYSSLSYLKQFPVDIVKIDKSFVDGLGSNPVDDAIVAAVVNLADAVGMATIAEGVETTMQLEHLQSLGCQAVQGYLLSRPITPEAVTQLLQAEDCAGRGRTTSARPGPVTVPS